MEHETLKVLLVEDNPADAKLIRLALKDARGPAFEVDWVQDSPEALKRLLKEGVDVVLTDLNLPSSSGLDTLTTLQAGARGAPLVVLTGSYLDAPMGRQAVQQGAQDYLDKKDLDGRVLARVLAFAIERKEIERFREEFLQNINHELRTPLTVAAGFLHLLLDDAVGPSQVEQRKVLEIVARNVKYMTELVEEMVEATRAGAGKLAVSPRRSDLGALIVRTIEEFRILAEEKGLLLSAKCSADLPPALADPKRCRQILFNLLANAIKFTPRGGRISVEAAPHPGDSGLLRICVADTGAGVPAEAKARIFDRLYRVRAQEKDGHRGLGLGLFICGELALRQGGRVWVEANPGGGSRFLFTLPRFSFAAALEPLLKAEDAPSELRLLECRILGGGHGLAGNDASQVLENAADILRSGAGPRGLLLPEAAPEGSEGTLYLALSGGEAAAARTLGRLEKSLAAALRPRATELRIIPHVIAARTGCGSAAELERDIEEIVCARRGRAPAPVLPF